MAALRVATYNLYLGADLALLFHVGDPDQLVDQVRVVRDQLDETRFEERAAAVAALLAREQPDLVGLQEVARWTVTPSGGAEEVLVDFLGTLTAELERAGCGYDVHAVDENFSGAMPLSDTERAALVGANVTLVRRGSAVEVVGEATGTFAESYRVVTAVEGVAFPIVRGWGRVDVLVEGRPLRFVNTHTEAYDGPTRDAQRDELLAANADGIDVPVVVVGDFNAGPDAVGMPGEWTDAWKLGEGDGFTTGQAADLANPVSLLRERIDYVWVRGAGLRDAWLIGDRPADRTARHGLWPSDHAGVVADLDV